MSPRGSFASVMSTGLQNFAYSPEFKPADEDEVSCLIKKLIHIVYLRDILTCF